MKTQIENHWIRRYSSGIIHLLINTQDKWLPWHRWRDLHYEVTFGEDLEYTEELVLTKEQLGLDPDTRYLCTECQEKDQMSYYYIPFELIR